MPTIRDVARLAQVSVTTVSRALNGQTGVTADTRRRVLDAASRLSFTPSFAARSLITRRTHAVGAVLADVHGEYLSELLRGIESAAHLRGLHLLVACPQGGDRDLAATLRELRGRVDGLLLMQSRGEGPALDVYAPAGLPMVLLNSRPEDSKHASIAVDNYGGALAMTQHLHGRGYRSIAFVAGPADDFDAQERLRGYRAAVAEAPGAAEMVLQGDFTEASGVHAGREIASMSDRPDAVFAANDLMAAGCLGAFADAGLAVPRDIALAGFDDLPMARHLNPPLTTVHVPIVELGSLGLDMLAGAIDAGDMQQPVRRTVAARLVVRESCAIEAPVRTFARRSTDRPSP